MAVDSSGNLYIADTTDNMVAMVARSACSSSCPFGLASTVMGDIYALAGTGTACSSHTPAGCGYTSGGVPQLATVAKLDAPSGVAVDSSGNLYIADTTDNMVAMVARSACSSSCPFGLASTVVGDIYALAGTGTACSTHTPAGCGYTSSGVAQLATVAKLGRSKGCGDGLVREPLHSRHHRQHGGDGGQVRLLVSMPVRVGFHGGGRHLCLGRHGHSLFHPHPRRLWLHLWRRGSVGDIGQPGRSLGSGSRLGREPLHSRQDRQHGGDGGEVRLCSSSCPFGLASTVVGDIYALAGTGTACSTHTPAGCGYTSGGVPQLATTANLDAPSGVAVDSSGNLYIADTTDNMVATIANSTCSSSCLMGLASTTVGDIYAIAGTGTASYAGDGGGAATTTLNAPSGVAVDSSGDVFIADTTNNRVRMVPSSSGTFFGQVMTRGDIYTVAGTGTACSTHTPAGCGYTSGGIPQFATTALLDLPSRVATDSSGNLYIADTSDNMVAMVARPACSSACPFGLVSTTTGDIYTIAGTGTACSTHTPAGCGYTSNGAAQVATSANLDVPGGAAVDSSGNLYIADTSDSLVAMVANSTCSSSCLMGLASTTIG